DGKDLAMKPLSALMFLLTLATMVQAQPVPLEQDAPPTRKQAMAWLDQGRDAFIEGKYEQAEQLVRKALAAYRTLYPPDRYPDGHHDLASALGALGIVTQGRRELVAAEPHLRQAVAILRKLYPPDQYPD